MNHYRTFAYQVVLQNLDGGPAHLSPQDMDLIHVRISQGQTFGGYDRPQGRICWNVAVAS